MRCLFHYRSRRQTPGAYGTEDDLVDSQSPSPVTSTSSSSSSCGGGQRFVPPAGLFCYERFSMLHHQRSVYGNRRHSVCVCVCVCASSFLFSGQSCRRRVEGNVRPAAGNVYSAQTVKAPGHQRASKGRRSRTLLIRSERRVFSLAFPLWHRLTLGIAGAAPLLNPRPLGPDVSVSFRCADSYGSSAR